MADKKRISATSKSIETEKAINNGPTSKQAFKKVEEEQRARLAKQRKVEEEWLQRLIQREEDRKKRIQKINTNEEDKKTIQIANVNKKSEVDTRQKLIKNSEVEQKQISAQMKHVKVIHRTQTLDRINEETECTSFRNQSVLAHQHQPSRVSPRRIYVSSSFG